MELFVTFVIFIIAIALTTGVLISGYLTIIGESEAALIVLLGTIMIFFVFSLFSPENSSYAKSEFYKQTQIQYEDYRINEKYNMLSDLLDKVGGKVNISDSSIVVGKDIYYVMTETPRYKDLLIINNKDKWIYKLDNLVTEIPNLHKDGISKGYNNVTVVVHNMITISDPLGFGCVKYLNEI